MVHVSEVAFAKWSVIFLEPTECKTENGTYKVRYIMCFVRCTILNGHSMIRPVYTTKKLRKNTANVSVSKYSY